MIEIAIQDEWDNGTSGLAYTPCTITGDCHFRGSSKADYNSLVQHKQKTRDAWRRLNVRNSMESTLNNTTFLSTTQVKFTYKIDVPYNTSILQQLPRVNDEFESFLNQSFVEASIQVVYMGSLLGASTTRCTPKDGLHICAVASSNLILAHDDNTTVVFKKADFDATSGESINVYFPLSSQQVHFIILNRFHFHMENRKDDTAEVSLITPVPTSTNLILQFTNQTITTMSQQDMEWLEMCATNFIQQYITNSGIITSIIPPTTFVLVSKKTEYVNDWRQDFPAIGSDVESNNVTSPENLYVNLFVAGLYNGLLQNNSNFDVAVKKLFQDKSDLLLQILRWSDMNHYDGLKSTKTTSSFFHDTQSINLMNPAPEGKAAVSIYEKPYLSKTREVVWFSFSAFCAASLLVLLFTLKIKIRAISKLRRKMRVDPEKKVGEDDCSLANKHGDPASMDQDLEQTITEDEKLPLSPKQETESPKTNRWSFSEALRNNSGSKTPRSPKPSKDEIGSNPPLFSRQSSSNGISNIRKRLSMSDIDSVQLLPVMKMDFSPD